MFKLAAFSKFLAHRIYRKPASLFPRLASVLTMARSNKTTNVLIYTGENGGDIFKSASKNLLSVLHPDRYVVYELTPSQVLVQPWKENIALLVVLCDTVDESTAEVFRNYLAKNGKMLVFCCNFTMPELGLSCTSSTESRVTVTYDGKTYADLYHGKVSYVFANAEAIVTGSDNNEPVVMKASCNLGTLVISAVHLVLDSDFLPKNPNEVPDNSKDRFNILRHVLGDVLGLQLGSFSLVPKSTPGYVFTMEYSERCQNLNGRKVPVEKCAEPETVSLIFRSETDPLLQFNKKKYSSNLKTRQLGHIAIYFPVITSTMIPAEHLSDLGGFVIIAGRQTSGAGRGSNQWISPEGCAMFTSHITFSLSSQLGQRISILQHMVTLAAVLAVRKIPGYGELDLRLKWPNDLYYGEDKKIGGALVRTTIQGSTVHAFIGLGVNVSNAFPTYCINSIIKDYNESTRHSLLPLAPEVFIARTLTELELMVDNFLDSGPDLFLSQYFLYWLHSNQVIQLSLPERKATIKGLDDYGYLLVNTDDGETLTLHPDGNSFNMMHNLIISKSS